MRRLIDSIWARFVVSAVRRRGIARGAAFACAVALGAAVLGGCGAPRLFGGGPGRGMRVVVFFAPGSHGGMLNAAGIKLLERHRSLVSAFTPLWYHVQNDGSVKSDMSKPLAAAIHKQVRVPLVPLVNNAKGATQFLVNAGARKTAVDNLVKIVEANNYQGIHIDFELLKPEDKQGLDLFMKELYGALHPKGKIVSIDVIPEKQVGQQGQAYDYRTLARYADSVVLMSYDQHDDGSQPGPVAALPWVKQRLSVALQAGIPANKLDLGVADYGYDWPVDASGKWIPGTKVPTLGMNQIEAKGVKPQRSGAAGEPHYSYTKGGTQHVVWYEDQVSVVGKVRLARQRALRGIALWRAGYDNAAYWNALQKALRG